MRPFTIYHLITQTFPGHLERLVSHILTLIQPDKIYLLGASLYQRRSESIFCAIAPASRTPDNFCLLILIDDLENKAVYEWQDKIEQHCQPIMNITTIFLQTNTFGEWLKNGHRFARRVLELSPAIYDSGKIKFSQPEHYDEELANKAIEKCFNDGLNRVREFLAGAELFRIREQYKMAAFMLHQATEQALTTMMKIGTGYYSHTHNLDRLIRYASLVCYKLPDIFPRKNEKDKHLFSLLQRAYSDSRYKEDYSISKNDLHFLIEKVTLISELLLKTRSAQVQNRICRDGIN